MDSSVVQLLFKEFENDNISFIYQGKFSNLALGMATDLVKNHVENEEGLSNIRNKLSFLMIESFQNIVRYRDTQHESADDMVSQLFITRHIKDVFYVITSNIIENEKIEYVKSKLNQVNTLSDDELKKLYIQVLTNKKLSEQGGAGLGFIEMVRKTKEKLEFDFSPISDAISFFYFQLKLRGKTEQAADENILQISSAKKIHKLVSEHNIMVVHKGNFSQEAIKPVLIMVEDNLQEQSLATQRKVFHLLVEMLQNISKHSAKLEGVNEGILILSKQNDYFLASTGNFVTSEEKIRLEKYLNYLLTLSKDELNAFYKKILRDGHEDESFSSGLGLIDIIRDSKLNIEFNFYPYPDNLYFFVIIAGI